MPTGELMESSLSGLHSLCLSGSLHSGVASIHQRLAMLGLFDFGILTCFSFPRVKEDYSLNNQRAIGYSRTSCKQHRDQSLTLRKKGNRHSFEWWTSSLGTAVKRRLSKAVLEGPSRTPWKLHWLCRARGC